MDKYVHKIQSVENNSIAWELEIEPGDYLLTINDTVIEDVFDYHYLVNDAFLKVVIRKGEGNTDAGEEWLLEIEKDYDEDLGITFEKSLMDDYRSCRNKCIFCFIDQMPKGMRETLYFKDDDSRLSFLQGNYVTLTNMTDRDIDKIIKYHLCPINISVHTTNKELRCRMLNNRFAGEALDKIKRLYDAGIEMNGQIVLCKGVNDGPELENTISELSGFIPAMRSLSVVPSGLTKYREGLYPLVPFEKEDAENIIKTVEKWQKSLYDKHGTHFVHASDEWYILADKDFPGGKRYDGYPQLENGVGMMRLMYDDSVKALKALKGDKKVRKISIATGYLACDMIKKLSAMISEKFVNTNITVYPIRNDFFGELITVSGLITGRDLINQLKGRDMGDILLLPSNMLRSGEDVFLDDITLDEVKRELNAEIGITGSSGRDFVDAVVNGKRKCKKMPKSDAFVYGKYHETLQNGGKHE